MLKASRDPKLLELVTWAVGRGARTFQNVRVTDDATLVATKAIQPFDFVLAVPQRLTFSVLDVNRFDETPAALRVSPKNFAGPVRWFPGVDWGTVAYAACCARIALSARGDTGRSAQLALIAEFFAQDDAHLTAAALEAAQSEHFCAATEDCLQQLGCSRQLFNESFALMYCGLRRTSVPLWSKRRTGATVFAKSPFGAPDAAPGDAIGSVPLVDLATHSSDPTCTFGSPDSVAASWLVAERNLKPDLDYFVLQATRHISVGDPITIDRNSFLGLDDKTFRLWFGRPYADDAAVTKSDQGSASSSVPTTEDKPTARHADDDVGDEEELFY